ETGPACTPDEHARLVREMVHSLGYQGPVGIGFPGPIKNGTPWMAVNLHPDWVDLNAAGMFSEATGLPCFMVNDADAAGLAEIRYGAGQDWANKVIYVCTLGTGIGSSIFVNGNLLPNSELGHITLRDEDAEQRASDAARRLKGLSWKKWAKRLQEYFEEIEKLISPDLIIIGGGVSKESEKFLPLLRLKAQVVPAKLLNDAGIIGAALYACQQTLK
ncbi:MAG: ROK family protein, partial [Anaerolineaceae bacterium]